MDAIGIVIGFILFFLLLKFVLVPKRDERGNVTQADIWKPFASAGIAIGVAILIIIYA